jgi:hypothetical protein
MCTDSKIYQKLSFFMHSRSLKTEVLTNYSFAITFYLKVMKAGACVSKQLPLQEVFSAFSFFPTCWYGWLEKYKIWGHKGKMYIFYIHYSYSLLLLYTDRLGGGVCWCQYTILHEKWCDIITSNIHPIPPLPYRIDWTRFIGGLFY